MIDAEKAIDAAAKEMTRFQASEVLLRVPVVVCVQVVSQIQLALRHPQNVSVNAEKGRAFCELVIKLIEQFSPDLAAFMRLGFDRQYDSGAFGGNDLRIALEESVKLQTHYAELLNMHDGGRRIGFADADAWIARLRETGSLPKI